MKKTILFLVCIILISGHVMAQKPEKAVKKLGPNPIFILDSAQVQQSVLSEVNPNTIAMVNMYYNQDAINLLGEKAKDGVVYIETREFARSRFVRFFRSYSSTYDSLITKAGSDKDFQYILNDKPQDENYEGNLVLVDNDHILELRIIDAAQLKNQYNITGKSAGIVIRSKRPEDLYQGRKKF